MNAAKEKSDEISNKVGIQNEQLYIFIIGGWYRNGMQIYMQIAHFGSSAAKLFTQKECCKRVICSC